MQKKQFINEVFIKQFINKNDEISLNLSIKVDEFIETLIKIQNDDGYAHLTIEKKKESNDKGLTHHIIVNTYCPPSKRIQFK